MVRAGFALGVSQEVFLALVADQSVELAPVVSGVTKAAGQAPVLVLRSA